MNVYLFFFFFQAEDGIRDHCVTGVQTCALPISLLRILVVAGEGGSASGLLQNLRQWRSEERRVGKSVDLGGRRIIKKKKTRIEKKRKHTCVNKRDANGR